VSEIQFIYYKNPADLPEPGSKQQFREKMNHWAYEITRVTQLPLQEPIQRTAESVDRYCNAPSNTSVGLHLQMTRP